MLKRPPRLGPRNVVAWSPFLLNQPVRVRLNERGRKIWTRFWEGYPDSQARVQPDGTLCEPLWHIMQVFGKHMGKGLGWPFDRRMEMGFWKTTEMDLDEFDA
jgi:hypothetical protein